MARVPLIEEKEHPELSELIGEDQRRAGWAVDQHLSLDAAQPRAGRRLVRLNQAVRYGTEIDGQCRELAVIRVAILNNVEYVVRAHGPAYALKEGLTPAQVEALADWSSSNLFTDKQRALLAYTGCDHARDRRSGSCICRSPQAFQRTADRRVNDADQRLQYVDSFSQGIESRSGALAGR